MSCIAAAPQGEVTSVTIYPMQIRYVVRALHPSAELSD
jgi:hypothetical protein